MARTSLTRAYSTGEEGQSLLPSAGGGEGGTASDQVEEDVGDARTRGLLRGFYGYSIASEVFAISSLTLFLPICLEQVAREHGVVAPAYTVPCGPSASSPGAEEVVCVVRLLGRWINSASFSLLVYSASVALQALTVISIGNLADDPHTRHRLLTTFATTGSLFTISFLLLPSSSPLWPLCALLAMGANVSFGASVVCLNSYLPEMGRNDPEVLRRHQTMEDAKGRLHLARESMDGLVDARELDYAVARDEYAKSKSAATSHVSSRGIALGYASGISALLILLVPVTLMGGSTFSLRCAIAGSGFIWGLGSIPALIYLRPSNLPLAALSSHKPTYIASIISGWQGLGSMLREWRRLPHTFTFLLAWLLLSDAFSTLTSTATLFGKTTLSMSTSSLIVIAALAPSSGIVGAIAFPHLQKTYLHYSNLQVLRLLVGLAILVPFWGLVGLRSSWQMYLLAIIFGGIYGSFQSYARTCFAELVPHSQAARWFGLYSITDKSSSFLGPLLVALLTNKTGRIRDGFWLIGGMMILACPVLYAVGMEEGGRDAELYSLSTVVEGQDEEEEGGGEGRL